MEQEKKEKTAIVVGGIGGLLALLFFMRRAEATPEDLIHGHVVAAEPPEDPIAGATVEVDGHASTTTNAQGYFKFTGIPEGLHLVKVSHPDRQPWEYQIYLWYGDLIQIRLYPYFAELTGVVTDATTGEPIKDILVDVDGSVAGTKSDGSYTVQYIIPGTYEVRLLDSDMRYDNVTVPNVEIPLEGATLDMQLHPLAPGAIQVSTSPAVEGVSIGVRYFDQWLGQWVVVADGKTDSSGQCFFADIPEGSYKIVARHIDYDTVEKLVTVYPDQTTTTTFYLKEATTVPFLVTSWRDRDTLESIWLQPGSTVSIFDAETHELVRSYTLSTPNRLKYLNDMPLGYHYATLDPITDPGDIQYHPLTTTPFLVARHGPKQYYDWGEVWPGYPECTVRLLLEKK